MFSRWIWFALSQTDETQIGDSPETAFVGVVREGSGEVRLSTLAAEEKHDLV